MIRLARFAAINSTGYSMGRPAEKSGGAGVLRFSALAGAGPILNLLALPSFCASAAAFRFCSVIMLSMKGPRVLVDPCLVMLGTVGSASAANSLTLSGRPSKS